jgi:aldehyde:ferredoxin oxidoreductase
MQLASVEIPWSVVMNMLGFCGFVFFTFDRPGLVELVRAVTGWEIDLQELLQAGQRGYTLARLFNLRAGLSRADDRVPEVFTRPFAAGPSAGSFLPPEKVSLALSMFYEWMGWDPKTGIPTDECLQRLGVGWAARQLDVPSATE